MKCPYSRRGHSWRPLTTPDATGLVDHARRVCIKCGESGYVDKQGCVMFGANLVSSTFSWLR